MATNTLASLRARLGGVGFCGDMVTGTADSNANTSLVVDAGIGNYSNDTFNYCQIAITSGTYSGSRRWITDFVTSTGTITVDAAFGGAISTGITFEIHRLFSADDKDAAINEAIRAAFPWFYRVHENELLTLSENTYDYALASITTPSVDRDIGIEDIYWNSDTTYDVWTRVDPNVYHLRDDNAVLYLQFDEEYLPGTDYDETLRIIYRTRPLTLSSDSSALDPDTTDFANYVCYQAAAFLFQRKADIGDEDKNEHWQRRADEMKLFAEAVKSRSRLVAPNKRPTRSGW